jgi:predicted house-cleaning noncanonical NTP pyrophosphatase (MazG superfamily)
MDLNKISSSPSSSTYDQRIQSNPKKESKKFAQIEFILQELAEVREGIPLKERQWILKQTDESFEKYTSLAEKKLSNGSEGREQLLEQLRQIELEKKRAILMQACSCGEVELVEELLKNGEVFNDGKTLDGNSLLLLAARSNQDQKLLRLLITHSNSFSDEEAIAILGIATEQTKRIFLKAYNRTLIKHTSLSSSPPSSKEARIAFLQSLNSEEKLKLFSHILSDEWMGDSEVESTQTALKGFRPECFQQYFLTAEENLFSGLMQEQQIIETLRSMRHFSEIASSDKNLVDQVHKKNGTLYFLAGWQGVKNDYPFPSTTGHALSGKITKNGEGYDLHLFNTGFGTQFHPRAADAENPPYGIVWKDIPHEVLNSDTLKQILSQPLIPNITIKLDAVEDLYNEAVINSGVYQNDKTLYLSLEGLFSLHGIQAQGYGDSITPQRAGTCPKQCFDTLFRDILKCVPQTTTAQGRGTPRYLLEYKVLKARERAIALEDAIATQEQVELEDRPQLIAIIREGNSELSTSLLKLLQLADRASLEDKEWIEQEIHKLTQQLLMLENRILQPDLLSHTATPFKIESLKTLTGSTTHPLRIEHAAPEIETEELLTKLREEIAPFHQKLCKGEAISVEEVTSWKNSFQKLFSQAIRCYPSDTFTAGLAIDNCVLELVQSINLYIGQAPSEETLTQLLSSLTELYQHLDIFNYRIRRVWSCALYLTTTQLFNCLTGKQNPWVKMAEGEIWSHSLQWSSLLQALYQGYQQSTMKDVQPLFDYSCYSWGESKPLEDALEYGYGCSPKFGALLKQLEVFKQKFLLIYANTEDLIEENGLVKFKNPSLEAKQPWRERQEAKKWKIDPSSSTILTEANFQFEDRRMLYHLIEGTTKDFFSAQVLLDPSHLRLLTTLPPGMKKKHLLAQWIEVLERSKGALKDNQHFLNALRSALYLHYQEGSPFITGDLSPLFNANQEMVHTFLDLLKEGSLSQELERATLSWEVLVIFSEQLEENPQAHPELRSHAIQIRETLSKVDKLQLSYILASTNEKEQTFHLGLYLHNTLLTQKDRSPDLKPLENLILAHSHWKRHLNSMEPQTYALRLESLYLRYIERHWKTMNQNLKEAALLGVLKECLPKEGYKIEIDHRSYFPSAKIYQEQPYGREPLLLGRFDGILGRFSFQKHIIQSLPMLHPEYFDPISREFFGEFFPSILSYQPNEKKFTIATDPSTSIRQILTPWMKCLEVEYELDGDTYCSIEPLNDYTGTPSLLSRGLRKLQSPETGKVLLVTWDQQRKKIMPKWTMDEQEITALESSYPPSIIGAKLGVLNPEGLAQFRPFLDRLGADSPPIFWFKEERLVGIELPGNIYFTCANEETHLYLEGHKYLLEELPPEEEPLALLNGNAFKLTDSENGQSFWLGNPNATGLFFDENHLRLHHLLACYAIKGEENKPRFYKIPLHGGQLYPTTEEHYLFLIEEAISAHAYRDAFTWTKELTARADFNPFDYWKVLEKWNWKAIGENPATTSILQLLYRRMNEYWAHRNPQRVANTTVMLYDKATAAMQLETEKFPKSKERYRKELSVVDSAKRLPNRWRKILVNKPTTEILPFSHRNYLTQEQVDAILKDVSAPLSHHLNDLVMLYSYQSHPQHKDLIIQKLKKFYEQHYWEYIELKLNQKSSETVYPISCFVGDLIREIAKHHKIVLDLPTNESLPPVLPRYERLLTEPLDNRTLQEISRPAIELIVKPFNREALQRVLEIEELKEFKIETLKANLVRVEHRILEKIKPKADKNLSDAIAALHQEEIPSIEELSQLLLTQDLSQWRTFRSYFASISEKELHLLREQVLGYIWLKTECNRVLQGISPAERRAYEIDDSLAPFFMLYEERAQLQLRPDQVQKLRFLLEGLMEDASDEAKVQAGKMLQSIMGSGKSKVLTPLILLYLNKQHNCIPAYMTTSALLPSAVKELAKTFSESFGIKTHQLKVDRAISVEGLQVLKEQVAEAKLGRAVLLTSADTLHSLYLLLFLLLLDDKHDAETDAKFLLVVEILKEFRENLALLVDECDVLFHPKEILSFPLGLGVPMPIEDCKAATELFFTYLSKLREELHISSEQSHAHDPTSLFGTLLRIIGEDLYSSTNNPLLKEWIAKMKETKFEEAVIIDALGKYMSNQPLEKEPKAILDEILSTNHGQELLNLSSKEIGIYQYAFGAKGGLAGALKASYKSQYGRSETHKEHHLAIPWSNGRPQEGTQFQSGYQTLFKTCLYYLHKWNDPQDTLLCINQGLKALVNTLDRMRHQELTNTFDYYQITSPITSEQLETLTRQIDEGLSSEHLESAEAIHARSMISFFLNHCVFPRELKSYLEQLTSTSHTLWHIGKKSLALSGTKEGSAAWKAEFKTLWDSTEIPKVLEKAIAKDRIYSVHIGDRSPPQERLEAIWKASKENTRTLIDVGGMFRGIPNIEIARGLFAIADTSDRPCHGVLYYSSESDGSSYLQLLLPSGETQQVSDGSRRGIVTLLQNKGLVSTQEEHDPEKIFESLRLLTYYDLAHTRGSDIPQMSNAHGLLLHDAQCSETDLQQAIMRMRNYLPQKLDQISQELTWVHRFEDNKKSTEIKDLIAAAQQKEAYQERIARAQSYLDKLHFGTEEILANYCFQGHSLSESRRLTSKVRSFLIDRSSDYQCFSHEPQREPNYLEKIENRLAQVQTLAEQIKEEYPEAAKDLLKLAEKVQNLIKRHEADLRTLRKEKQTDAGVLKQEVQLSQEQELELQQQLNTKRNRHIHVYDTKDPIGCDSPLFTPDNLEYTDEEYYETRDLKIGRISLSSFLGKGHSPNLFSSRLTLSSTVWTTQSCNPSNLQIPSMPWEGLTYFIEGVVLYNAEDPSQKSQRMGIAIRGNDYIKNSSENVYSNFSYYTLRGDCIAQESGACEEFSGFSTRAFKRPNLFEENDPHSHDVEILCSAILLAGDIQLLTIDPQSKRNEHFFRWLNNEGDQIKAERIKIFFQTYSHRADHPYLEQYKETEFSELMSLLERESKKDL